MPIQSITHVEFHCADADKAAADLCADFGFTPEESGPEESVARESGAERAVSEGPGATAPGGVRAVHLRQGGIRLRLLSAADPAHPVADYVARHGDGVAVIALGCTDPQASLERAERHGARVLDRAGRLVAGFGDLALRFVPQPPETGPEPQAGQEPQSGHGSAGARSATGTGTGTLLDALDHAAICVPAGELEPAVRFCEAALGLHRIFGEYIEVGEQAMDSSVVQSASGEVTFTLIEPDTGRRPGQIDTFLADHGGAGVQHLAFRTDDIATAVRTIRGRGVEFLSTPGAYYDALAERLGGTAIPVGTLRELDVLVDQDHGGQLFQIFARSTHPRRTYFLELIERQGAGTFGTANIKALYEAVERQNAVASA
ncbi:4-hydroxyphenylpyruvate dioxygenase [Streptomyces sp. CB01881]|uniref:4-hydroxyphenylpyruvate dioxygenase n=1 Tax=Streptomyces sp. CB01881 TaxID=2078691 RepID=UPI000CDC5E1A|nr:4-hydroxyphenylpyruvate dioxygenase [Streptomyces sp. CB01881]AUY47999.1 4-hydroxyphenylpyruvate dioxygenase [Streptomyces sp. CB01881]TYC76479.1 4-hydroxyphenylpyruvate dioxygenase [Streptomyces sp. CB01881]